MRRTKLTGSFTVFPDDILELLVVGQQSVDQRLVDCHGFSYSQLSHGRLHSSFYTLGLRGNLQGATALPIAQRLDLVE
jgi:hypothetical protein